MHDTISLTPQILVVGAGSIGSSMSGWLANGFAVRVVDNVQRSVDNRVEFIECDVRNFDALRRAAEGVDLVIHTAIVQIPQINDEKRLGYEVNIQGTQNVCEVVKQTPSIKGMILTGSWHTIGERNIKGIVDEKFGYRPDMVEERARLYALSKMAQESIVRYFGEESPEKIYGVIRIGTALGPNMPPKTAASIFVEQALTRQPLTPFDNSMHRPMLYVDISDVCRAFEVYAQKIINSKVNNSGNSLTEVVNAYYPHPTTILELAKMVKDAVTNISKGHICPQIKVVKTGQRSVFRSRDKNLMKVDVSKAREFLGIKRFSSPFQAIQKIVEARLANEQPAYT
jgi:UDP-glucose 4-epimerase